MPRALDYEAKFSDLHFEIDDHPSSMWLAKAQLKFNNGYGASVVLKLLGGQPGYEVAIMLQSGNDLLVAHRHGAVGPYFHYDDVQNVRTEAEVEDILTKILRLPRKA